jgi:hypothetical protein
VDQVWGGGEEEAHRGGLSIVEGIGGGEKMSASRSRGHQLGQSGWGGNTRRRDAWGVVDSAEERLEWAVRAVRIERGGAAVRDRRGCWGWSWKGRRGAPTRGGARGGGAPWTGVWQSVLARCEEK